MSTKNGNGSLNPRVSPVGKIENKQVYKDGMSFTKIIENNNNNKSIIDAFADYPCRIVSDFELDFDDPIISPPPGFIDQKAMFADVIVRNPASPQNFQVQSYREAPILEKMEFEMKEFYDELFKSKSFRRIDNSEIIVNGYYVAKIDSKDGKWFRCRVERFYDDDEKTIWIHLIDHGNFEMINSANIYLLRKAYRRLPIQAFNAHMYFSPKEKYIWDTETCLKFREDVEGTIKNLLATWTVVVGSRSKAFCAIVIDEIYDILTKTSSLALILVDTSSPQDKYVHHKLRSMYNKKFNHS